MPQNAGKTTVVANNARGFQPLLPQYSIRELGENLIKNDNGKNIENAGETAIPDICAHIKYLRQKLREPVLDMRDQAVLSWVGTLAIVALSELRNFELEYWFVPLKGEKIMKSVYRNALSECGMLDNNDCIQVLAFHGNPIAVLDTAPENGCYCYPFSTIRNPNSVMDKVEWFVSQNDDSHFWVDVTGKDRANDDYLHPVEKASFVLWLDALKTNNMAIHYRNAVDTLIKSLNSEIVTPNTSEIIRLENSFNNANARWQNVLAWRGILSCIAMSAMSGYTIDLAKVKGNSPVQEVFFRSKGRDFNNPMMMLCVDDAHLGWLDVDYLVRPLYNVVDELSRVPWFVDGEWLDIATLPSVSDIQKRRLAKWFYELANLVSNEKASLRKQLINAGDALVNKREDALEYSKTASVSIFKSMTLRDRTKIPSEFWESCKLLEKVPDYKVTMPAYNDIFAPKLVLTLADMDNGTLFENRLGISSDKVHNTIQIQDVQNVFNERMETFQALLPLKAKFTSEYLCNAELTLTEFKMEYNAEMQRIEVFLELDNDGVTVPFYKEYSIEENVLFLERFSYVSLWPYIRAVDSNGNSQWNKYYVTWSPSIQHFGNSTILHEYQPIQVTPSVQTETVRTIDGGDSWELMTYDHFPEYIHFEYSDGGNPVDLGCIYVKPPELHHIEHTYLAAVDFGASNTIVRFADGSRVIQDSNKPAAVFTNSMVEPLVCTEYEGFIRQVREFHSLNWLPYYGKNTSSRDNIEFWERDLSKETDRIPTVAKLYAGANNVNTLVPRYGQLLRTDCYVMADLLKKYGEKHSEDFGVHSNIKMRRGVNSEIGTIAVGMLLLECALAAMQRNAALQFVISYPDAEMWKQQKFYWTEAMEHAKEICNNIITNPNNLLRTTELWAAKYYSEEVNERPDTMIGYGMVDIGGGTSDISLWHCDDPLDPSQMRGALSLRYAGNQIISESLFSFFRRTGDCGAFDSLWDLAAESAVIKNYHTEMKKGFQKLLDEEKNLAGTDVIEQIQKDVPLLSSTLVANKNFSSRVSYDMGLQSFHSLVSLKLCNVFYVVARYLELTKAFDQNHPNSPYVIYLYGGGSSAYDVCDRDALDDLTNNILCTFVSKRRYEVRVNRGNDRKTEVVRGMCKLAQDKLAQNAINIDQLIPSMFTPDTPAPVDSANTDADFETVFNWMRTSYEEYIDFIHRNKKYFAVESGETMYDWLNLKVDRNQKLYDKHARNILSQVYQDYDRSTPPEMLAHIAVIKLIDYILLVVRMKK